MKFHNRPYSLQGVILLIIFLAGCHFSDPATKDSTPITIAISKAVPEESYRFYGKWLQYADSNVVWYDMYHLDLDSALVLLQTCDGLLLTGGTDIYPGRYGKENELERCWEPDFKRDTLESVLFKAAQNEGMPVMGICRGLQMINIEMGGRLYIDIPEDLDTAVVHRSKQKYDTRHQIRIESPSLLEVISGRKSGMVNSNHHQGIEFLAPGLSGIAFTEDGLIEAIQRNDPEEPFLLGVQWHPERMDYSNPLSGKIAMRFLREAGNYSKRP